MGRRGAISVVLFLMWGKGFFKAEGFAAFPKSGQIQNLPDLFWKFEEIQLQNKPGCFVTVSHVSHPGLCDLYYPSELSYLSSS